MALKRLSLTRGDSQTYTITFKKKDGTVWDITNWVVFFTLKTNYNLPDSAASLQKIVTTFTAPSTGVAVISLLPQDTINLEPGEYDFDIYVRTAANESYTVVKGKFNIEYDVTRETGTAGTA
jgi:hypothetical protein